MRIFQDCYSRLDGWMEGLQVLRLIILNFLMPRNIGWTKICIATQPADEFRNKFYDAPPLRDILIRISFSWSDKEKNSQV